MFLTAQFRSKSSSLSLSPTVWSTQMCNLELLILPLERAANVENSENSSKVPYLATCAEPWLTDPRYMFVSLSFHVSRRRRRRRLPALKPSQEPKKRRFRRNFCQTPTTFLRAFDCSVVRVIATPSVRWRPSSKIWLFFQCVTKTAHANMCFLLENSHFPTVHFWTAKFSLTKKKKERGMKCEQISTNLTFFRCTHKTLTTRCDGNDTAGFVSGRNTSDKKWGNKRKNRYVLCLILSLLIKVSI